MSESNVENSSTANVERELPKQTVAESEAEESIEVGKCDSTPDYSDKEAMIQRIRKGEDRAKRSVLAFLMIILVATIIARLLNTPTETKAAKSDIIPSRQKQDVSTAESIEATPRIEAISISGNGPASALIEGEIVREGDTINGFNVLRIDPNRVQFEKDGRITEGVFPPPTRPVKPKSK